MTCYPGDPGFKLRCACNFPIQIAPGVAISVHQLTFSTHTGTHVDAPFHFFPDGEKLSDLPLERFVGRAVVLDVRHAARDRAQIRWTDIDVEHNKAHLEQIGPRSEGKADIILLRTGWEDYWDTPKYFAHPYLSRDAAEGLRDVGVQMAGVDTLSPDETPGDDGGEPKADGFAAHEVLLGAGRLICENLKGIGALVDQGDGEVWLQPNARLVK
ncbi:hypothetical protein ID866_8211 [Astraeus odoratus]|nr:hypothetical protein ID866_8211 [Astraeus odoratus]